MKFSTFDQDLESGGQGYLRFRYSKGTFSYHKLSFDVLNLNIKTILSDYKGLKKLTFGTFGFDLVLCQGHQRSRHQKDLSLHYKLSI